MCQLAETCCDGPSLSDAKRRYLDAGESVCLRLNKPISQCVSWSHGNVMAFCLFVPSTGTPERTSLLGMNVMLNG